MPNREDYVREVVEQLTDYLDENMPNFEKGLTITINHWKYPTELVVTFKERKNTKLGRSGDTLTIKDGI